MSITPTTKTRSIRAKIALVPALSLGLLGGSVAMAAPASADYNSDRDRDSRNGCKVSPGTPENERGDRVNFRINVDCDDGRKTVHVKQRLYEDRRDDRRFASYEHEYKVDRWDRRINDTHYLPRYIDEGDRVFHEISFAVEDRNGHVGKWSDWKKSGTLTVD